MGDERYLFTSESVAPGHPDKLADQISDAVLDAVIEQDRDSRVACETLVTTGMALLAGEITSHAMVDYTAVARDTMREVGYTDPEVGLDADSCAVLVSFGRQSPDIARGVDREGPEHGPQGAGDQGMMVGFACRETPELMPLPIMLAHRIMMRLRDARCDGTLPYLRPDGKSQVSVEYEHHTPIRVHTVVLSAQHSPDVEMERMKENAWCCGGGGGVKSAFADFALWTATERLEEAKATGAEALVSACPLCKMNFSDAAKAGAGDMAIYDITELVAQAI